MTGVLLIAFGRRGYGLMAHNLAFSLRHYAPDLHITLYASDDLSGTYNPALFSDVRALPKELYLHPVTGRIDPARAKCRIYELGISAGLDRFLFLDVDALALADIRPLLEALRDRKVATDIQGRGGKGDNILYNIWATNETMWKHFRLADNATLCGVQSSWMYFERSKTGQAIQDFATYYLSQGRPAAGLTHEWGKSGGLPDEFVYQGVFAKLGLIPEAPATERKPIFFGNAQALETPEQVKSRYHILSIYGQGGNKPLTLRKWQEMYDRELSKMGGTWFASEAVMKDKHANF